MITSHHSGSDGVAQRRAWLNRLVASGRLEATQLGAARRALDLAPTAQAWAHLLVATLLAAGLALLAAALVFAVAFNWNALGHFSRFALVQTALALFLLAAWWRGVHTIAGEAALFAAALATGALLALFGQTYQTGADPYSLFVVWALLLLPWALHACHVSLWLLWLAIANTGLSLYCGQVLGELGWVRLFGMLEWSAALAIVMNGLLLLAFEGLPVLGSPQLARAVPRVLAVIVLAAVAAVLIPLVGWRHYHEASGLHRLAMAALGAGSFALIAWWYATRRRDVPVLAAAMLCAISVGYALLLRTEPGAAFGFFLLSAMYWIGTIAAAVAWLRTLSAPAGSDASGAGQGGAGKDGQDSAGNGGAAGKAKGDGHE